MCYVNDEPEGNVLYSGTVMLCAYKHIIRLKRPIVIIYYGVVVVFKINSVLFSLVLSN